MRKNKPDKWLLIISGSILAIGLVMLYSASTVESLQRFGNTTYFIKHQVLNGGLVGFLGFLFFYRIPLKKLRLLALPLMILSLVLLSLVKVPGIGFSAGGASRWIHFGPIFFQPSEVLKLAVVVYASAWLAGRNSYRVFSESLGPMLAAVGLGSLLILWQPDFGTMIAVLGTVFLLVVASNVPWRWILSMGAAGVAGLLVLIKLEPYRMQRFLTYLNPTIDPQGSGYQLLQGLLAIGSGGVWGLGYGLSKQKYNFLPEVLGDSIFAVVAEELGFVRILAILLLYLFLFVRGLQIANATPDKFGRFLAVGVVAMLSVQLFVNVGAILGLLPLTGIPMPFFSYGSSSFIVNLCALGILINVSREAKLS